MKNQCDGCNAGIPLKNGIHWAPYPSGPIACTKHMYNEKRDKLFRNTEDKESKDDTKLEG